MQNNKQFDNHPAGNVRWYEDFFLQERRGEWVAHNIIEKKRYEFDDEGLLIKEQTIKSDSTVESEVLYKYFEGRLVEEITTNNWGTSIRVNTYDNKGNLTYFKQLNPNNNFSCQFNYDEHGRPSKEIVEYSDEGKDIYEYKYREENEIIIVETSINGKLDSTEHMNKNGAIIMRTSLIAEKREFVYSEDGLLLKEIVGDYIREFEYDSHQLPIRYHGYRKLESGREEFNKEYYDIELDDRGNWKEIKSYVETESFPKHLKLIRRRTIEYV